MAASDWIWGGLLAAGAAYEVYTLLSRRPGDTLSETTRRTLRTRTRVGRIAFAVAWLAFSAWFLCHVLKG